MLVSTTTSRLNILYVYQSNFVRNIHYKISMIHYITHRQYQSLLNTPQPTHNIKIYIFVHYVVSLPHYNHIKIQTLCSLPATLYIYIYIHVRLKIKPNSVRIRSLSCQIFVLPSTGFELTPLIH
jgi:hypothetical protein